MHRQPHPITQPSTQPRGISIGIGFPVSSPALYGIKSTSQKSPAPKLKIFLFLFRFKYHYLTGLFQGEALLQLIGKRWRRNRFSIQFSSYPISRNTITVNASILSPSSSWKEPPIKSWLINGIVHPGLTGPHCPFPFLTPQVLLFA